MHMYTSNVYTYLYGADKINTNLGTALTGILIFRSTFLCSKGCPGAFSEVLIDKER